jgi:hypothetical protein
MFFWIWQWLPQANVPLGHRKIEVEVGNSATFIVTQTDSRRSQQHCNA